MSNRPGQTVDDTRETRKGPRDEFNDVLNDFLWFLCHNAVL